MIFEKPLLLSVQIIIKDWVFQMDSLCCLSFPGSVSSDKVFSGVFWLYLSHLLWLPESIHWSRSTPSISVIIFSHIFKIQIQIVLYLKHIVLVVGASSLWDEVTNCLQLLRRSKSMSVLFLYMFAVPMTLCPKH